MGDSGGKSAKTAWPSSPLSSDTPPVVLLPHVQWHYNRYYHYCHPGGPVMLASASKQNEDRKARRTTQCKRNLQFRKGGRGGQGRQSAMCSCVSVCQQTMAAIMLNVLHPPVDVKITYVCMWPRARDPYTARLHSYGCTHQNQNRRSRWFCCSRHGRFQRSVCFGYVCVYVCVSVYCWIAFCVYSHWLVARHSRLPYNNLYIFIFTYISGIPCSGSEINVHNSINLNLFWNARCFLLCFFRWLKQKGRVLYPLATNTHSPPPCLTHTIARNNMKKKEEHTTSYFKV